MVGQLECIKIKTFSHQKYLSESEKEGNRMGKVICN